MFGIMGKGLLGPASVAGCRMVICGKSSPAPAEADLHIGTWRMLYGL